MAATMSAGSTMGPMALMPSGRVPKMPAPIMAPMPFAIQPKRPIFFTFSALLIGGMTSFSSLLSYFSSGSGLTGMNLARFITGCWSLSAPGRGQTMTQAPQ